MTLPTGIKDKCLARFDVLIAEGKRIHAAIKTTRHQHEDWTRREPVVTEQHVIDWPSFVEWRTKCKSLLTYVFPLSNPHRAAGEKFDRLSNTKDQLEFGIALLTALREDLEQGFLDDLGAKVEAELAADYLGQAEGLLQEGQTGKYDHIPAAVLAGAVLEKGLRALCGNQQPPVPTTDAKGAPIMLNGLIDGLKKSGAFNELIAKQLRAWAAVRNHAAHGEFDAFKRDDVELMLKGVGNFLSQLA